MDRGFLNVILLGFGFMFVFTAFQTMGNIEVRGYVVLCRRRETCRVRASAGAGPGHELDLARGLLSLPSALHRAAPPAARRETGREHSSPLEAPGPPPMGTPGHRDRWPCGAVRVTAPARRERCSHRVGAAGLNFASIGLPA